MVMHQNVWKSEHLFRTQELCPMDAPCPKPNLFSEYYICHWNTIKPWWVWSNPPFVVNLALGDQKPHASLTTSCISNYSISLLTTSEECLSLSACTLSTSFEIWYLLTEKMWVDSKLQYVTIQMSGLWYSNSLLFFYMHQYLCKESQGGLVNQTP